MIEQKIDEKNLIKPTFSKELKQLIVQLSEVDPNRRPTIEQLKYNPYLQFNTLLSTHSSQIAEITVSQIQKEMSHVNSQLENLQNKIIEFNESQ